MFRLAHWRLLSRCLENPVHFSLKHFDVRCSRKGLNCQLQKFFPYFSWALCPFIVIKMWMERLKKSTSSTVMQRYFLELTQSSSVVIFVLIHRLKPKKHWNLLGTLLRPMEQYCKRGRGSNILLEEGVCDFLNARSKGCSRLGKPKLTANSVKN